MVDILLRMMDFVLKTMDFVLKTMDCMPRIRAAAVSRDAGRISLSSVGVIHFLYFCSTTSRRLSRQTELIQRQRTYSGESLSHKVHQFGTVSQELFLWLSDRI